MAAAFDAVEAEFGGIDVVVNTAGTVMLSPLATLDLADLDRMHRTNIRGTFVVSQLAANRLRTGGALINFSTSVMRTQLPAYGAYVASKAAVESMTLILARELRGKDITVNAVAPAPPPRRSSWTERTRAPSTTLPRPSHWSGWGPPPTSPSPSRSSPARHVGSTARFSTPTAASPERRLISSKVIRSPCPL